MRAPPSVAIAPVCEIRLRPLRSSVCLDADNVLVARTNLAPSAPLHHPASIAEGQLREEDRAHAHVAAAGLHDVGEPQARLSRTLLKTLNLDDGAHIRLVAGDQSILLKAVGGGAEDDGLDVVRLDGAQRRKLGVEVGDTVVVEPYEGRRAERICLIALGRIDEADLPVKEIRDALAERPVIVGDTVKVTPTRKTFDAQLNVLGLTVAGVTGEVNDADGVMLRVSETMPPGVVTVDDATQLDVRHADALVSNEESAGP